jgi:hypothetical protein
MIRGKVARILSDEEVILNVGRKHGVTEGTEFVIFSVSEADRITDPETGADLGAIETTKGRVKVHHVQDQISRARTLTYQVPPPSIEQSVSLLASRLRETPVETRRRKLRVAEEQILEFDEDPVVKVGDSVRSV